MPLASVITAAWAPSADFLHAAYDSLASQHGLGPWEWEWLIQEDGQDPSLERRLPADPRIRYAAARLSAGIATTRNLALQRARGDLVRELDQDDLLLPFGLIRPIEALAAAPEDVVWAAGERLELLPDGQVSLTPMTDRLPPGRIRPRLLMEILEETDKFPIHCGGLTMRTEVARAFGGWTALPRSEDICLLAAMSTVFSGLYSPIPTFLYQRWPKQTQEAPWWQALKPGRRVAIRQRAEAVARIFQLAAGTSAEESVSSELETDGGRRGPGRTAPAR